MLGERGGAWQSHGAETKESSWVDHQGVSVSTLGRAWIKRRATIGARVQLVTGMFTLMVACIEATGQRWIVNMRRSSGTVHYASYWYKELGQSICV